MRYAVTSSWPFRKVLYFTLPELQVALNAREVDPKWKVQVGLAASEAIEVETFLRDMLARDALRWIKSANNELRGVIRYRVASLETASVVNASITAFHRVSSVVEKGVETSCVKTYSLSGKWPHPFVLRIFHRDREERPELLERIAHVGSWAWTKELGGSMSELAFSSDVFHSIGSSLLDRDCDEVVVEMTLVPKGAPSGDGHYSDCIVEAARVETILHL